MRTCETVVPGLRLPSQHDKRGVKKVTVSTWTVCLAEGGGGGNTFRVATGTGGTVEESEARKEVERARK